jgi:glycosyltransferase involved in cell wall biosynthesis
MKLSELSVFLPIFNEEEIIGNVVLKTLEVLNKTAEKWELILIDDGSSDGTSKIISDLSRSEKRIKIITHKSNQGYGTDLKEGFYTAKYKWISFIDSDGQFEFSEIVNFIKKQRETNADVVVGYYKKRQVSKIKILTSKIWELTVYLFFGLKVKDIDCGFKLISKEVIYKIPKLISERGAFISSELLIKAKRANFKIVEIPVTHYPRLTGEGTGRKLNVIVRSYIDLVKLWINQQ